MLLTLQSEVQGCQRCGTLSRRLVLPVLSGAASAAPAAAKPAQRAMKRTYSSLWTGEDLAEDYGDSTAGAPKDRRAGALCFPSHMPCLLLVPAAASAFHSACRHSDGCSTHACGPTASFVSCPTFGTARCRLSHRRHHSPHLPARALWNGRDRVGSTCACGLDGICRALPLAGGESLNLSRLDPFASIPPARLLQTHLYLRVHGRMHKFLRCLMSACEAVRSAYARCCRCVPRKTFSGPPIPAWMPCAATR